MANENDFYAMMTATGSDVHVLGVKENAASEETTVVVAISVAVIEKKAKQHEQKSEEEIELKEVNDDAT